MAEIDFEELDRAVNSLIGKAPASTSTIDDDGGTAGLRPDHTDSTPLLQTTPATNRTPSLEEPQASPIASPDDVVSSDTGSSQPAIKPRRGRFMDMINPSSPEKAEETLMSPSQRASRQARMLKPRSGTLIADIVKKSNHPKDKPSAESTAADQSTSSSDMPDPLDMTTHEHTLTPTVSTLTSKDSATATSSDNAGSTGNNFSAFLPNAKVEKRPLGQPASLAESPDVSEPEKPIEAEVRSPETADVGAPAEYDTQLVAIESGNTGEIAVADDTSDHQAEVPADDSDSDDAPTTVTQEVAPTTVTHTKESHLAGPASIAQQYQEQPSSGDQSSGAIFDTASYHQPLSHPAKKASGWLWVVLIIFVIMLGVGGGAFIYLNNI